MTLLAVALTCLEALDAMGVAYAPARAAGVEDAVEVEGPLGGVTYVPLGHDRPLVLDCSLVYSLAQAGRFFVEQGLTTAYFSDALHRRYVKGTTRWSKHSYGLALDVHRWQDGSGRRLSVADDYELGLGRGRDCLGHAAGERGREIRLLWCRLERSELFKLVLDPDFDEDHRDHFHLQALPWAERDDLAWR